MKAYNEETTTGRMTCNMVWILDKEEARFIHHALEEYFKSHKRAKKHKDILRLLDGTVGY